MKKAWEESTLTSRRDDALHTLEEQDDAPATCCCCTVSPCSTCCKIFLKYTVGRSLQLFLYVLDIATDVSVAVADYNNGDINFALITLGLVFAPGFLFALYACIDVISNHTGLLVCLKAPLWFFSFPVLPLWPVLRDLQQIYHGVLALFPERRDHHLEYLHRPSRAYLIKFLEAFTEAAPQVLLRLYKITIRRQELPFSQIETMEAIQVSISLVSLASKIISTYQKNVTTNQVVEGELEDTERFRLPCCVQVLAFLWWASFLVARFEVMALFAGALKSWLFVVIGVHVLLVFLFQTVAAGKNKVRRVFIYLFTGFVFIFAYLEFNMRSRIKMAPWFSYTVYTVLVFIENSIMLVVWYMAQKEAAATDTKENQLLYTTFRERLIFVHYGAFCFGLIMMIATFCCPVRPHGKVINDDVKEMSTLSH